MVGTGGCRKLRLARRGKGKSGGFRVIYYYTSRSGRVFLLTAYSKSSQENLTHEQRNYLRAAVEHLK